MSKQLVKTTQTYATSSAITIASDGLPKIDVEALVKQLALELAKSGLAQKSLVLKEVSLELVFEQPSSAPATDSSVTDLVEKLLSSGKAPALEISSIKSVTMGISTL
jgi:hypothetical protein